MDTEQLLQALTAQAEAAKALQASVEALATQTGLLVQAVAMLLGEEVGQPADKADEPDPLGTLDGEPVTFRGAHNG